MIRFALPFVLVTVLMACAAPISRSAGADHQSLKPCSSARRCVSSEVDESSRHYIKPIEIGGSSEEVVRVRLIEAIIEMHGSINKSEVDHLSATFTSRIFGFTDDLEIRIDMDSGLIQVRSGARIGYYDFDVNRNRVNDLRKRMQSHQVK